MAVNPYESPLLPAADEPSDDPPVAWPATGAFRYYQTLVWHTATPLPKICVRTGAPADSTEKLTLLPLIDDDGTVPPAFDLKTRLYAVELPIYAAGSKANDWRQTGVICLVAGLVCTVAALVWPASRFTVYPFNVLAAGLFGFGAVALLAVGLRWLAGPMRIQLLCVDRTYVQLYGLHPSFLMALPDWPVPDRDSVRRRVE